MNDVWSLNVSTITGPPYAIFGIHPALGPITGKTKIQISGDGFKDSQNIIIRFSSINLKGDKEAFGIFKNEQEIECETPAFDIPRKVTLNNSLKG